MTTSRDALVLFAPTVPDHPWRWCRVEGDRVESGVGRDDRPARRVILVVPGWAVAARRVQARGSGRQRRTDALFLAEETIAGAVDDLHAVIHPEAGGSSAVWLTDPARLAAWIAEASAGGRVPDMAVPDYICLPDGGESELSVCHSGNILFLRDGLWGVSADGELGIERGLIAASAGDARSSKAVFTEASEPDTLCRAMAIEAVCCDVSLLTGRFAPSGQWRKARRLWAASMGLAAGCVLAGLALILIEAEQFRAEAETERARTEGILRSAFPEAQDFSDPHRFLHRMSESGERDFLLLSGILAEALSAAPGVGVQSLAFDVDTARMRIEIRFDSYRAVRALREAIEKSGAIASQGASRQDGDMRIGQMTLVAGP